MSKAHNDGAYRKAAANATTSRPTMHDPDRCQCTWQRIDHDDCCTDDDCRCTIHHEGEK